MSVDIHEIILETIQGEGHHAGRPVDFIRLHGCPVGCYFCDTGYADGSKGIPRERIEIQSLLNCLKSQHVVISGGEPMLNPQISDLCCFLKESGRKVQIETSGAFWQDIPDDVWVTLSPKDHVSKKFPALDKAWGRANEIKIVVSDGTEVDFYQNRLYLEKKWYLQPEWGKSEFATRKILELIKIYPKMSLSLQTHKLIGVP